MNNYLRKALTIIGCFIFIWFWPVRLFTNKSNCYFFVLEQWLMNGGKAQWYQSKRWIGYHVIWVDRSGQKIEYTIPRLRRGTPWYKMLFYDGEVRRFREFRKDQ